MSSTLDLLAIFACFDDVVFGLFGPAGIASSDLS